MPEMSWHESDLIPSKTDFMKCGHAANAKKDDGSPVCVICYGIVSGADEVVTDPDLTGRFATCSYGTHGRVPSSTNLPFFSHRQDRDYDTYYCGCFGWD